MTALVAALPKGLRNLDPALMLIAAVFVALLLLDPGEVTNIAIFAVKAALGVAPFLLMSIMIAAYASASSADNLIAKAFQGRQATMIIAAALVGALSPFCSCGVIPLIAALLTMGVPLAPVMAFWLASPIMDPSMFILTAGTLGTDFAIAKTAAAIGVGMFGGFGMWLLTSRGLLANPLRAGIGDGGCGGSTVRAPDPVVWKFWREPARITKFRNSTISNTLFLGKWLMLAFVLEGVMLTYVPADFVKSVAGSGGYLTVLGATLVGIPAYLNGYAALPLVSGLLDQGMAPGAGMAFLIAGGVTSIPAAIAVFALARLPVFALYILFALIGSFTAGILWQALMVV